MPGEPTTILGGLTQGLTQYLTVAAPVGAVIRSALVGAEAAAALPRFITVAGPGGKTLQVAVAGAEEGIKTFGRRMLDWAMTYAGADPVADFLAFEPNDPRAANIFNQYFPGAPEIAKVVTEYLAATGNDSQLEGRLKNVLEGRILDATVVGTLLGSFKLLKVAREAVSRVPMPDIPAEVATALDRLEPATTAILRSEVGGVRTPSALREPGAVEPPKKEKVKRGPRTPPKPPSLDRDLTYAEMGKGSNSWYHGVGDYVKRKLGIRDGNVFLDFMAIASQGQMAGISDLNIAIDTFNRFRRGEDPELLVEELSIGNVTGPNIRKHLLAYMQGKKLVDLFGDEALKIRDYRRALDGDPNVVVVDRWMWRTYYPDDWNAAKAKFEAAEEIAYPQRLAAHPAALAEYEAKKARGETVKKKPPKEPKKRKFSAWEGSNYQYRMIQDRITTEAQRLGMNPSDLQAQIWAGIKLATEGPKATGLDPMKVMVEARFKAGEIKRLPGQSVAALIQSEAVTRTAGILAALVAGHYAGDTDEEQAYFGLLAAGLTPGGARLMAKDLANLVPAAAALRNTQVAPEGRLKRVYHGTAQTFDQFDPAKADPAALYGPAAGYFTEDPKVAGGTGPGKLGYAQPRGLNQYKAEFFATEAEAAAFAKTTENAQVTKLPHYYRDRPFQVTFLDPERTAAPQVRPAYLDIQRPFDINKEFTEDEVWQIGQASGHDVVQREDLPEMHENTLWAKVEHGPTGENIYRVLEGAFGGDRAAVNDALEAAGFDGITHVGGAITGTSPHTGLDCLQARADPLAIRSRGAKRGWRRCIAGGGPEVVTPDDPRSMADQYAAAVIEARRGGPRTHELVQAEAQSLIDQGPRLLGQDPGDEAGHHARGCAHRRDRGHARGLRPEDASAHEASARRPPIRQKPCAHARAVVQQLWMHAQLDPKRIGVLTETGRTLSALTDPTSGLNQFLQQFEFLMRDQNAPHRSDGRRAGHRPDAGSGATRGPREAGHETRLLAGVQRVLRQRLALGAEVVDGELRGQRRHDALGDSRAGARGADGRPRAGVQAGEAIAMMEGLTNGITSAWRLAATAFKEGESQFE